LLRPEAAFAARERRTRWSGSEYASRPLVQTPHRRLRRHLPHKGKAFSAFSHPDTKAHAAQDISHCLTIAPKISSSEIVAKVLA
jgi:hypothetical protein